MDLKLRKTHVVHATTSAIALAALTVCTPALAQDDGPGYAIEEITVTAQKREENLQETPIAITALSEAAIEDRGIKNVQDMFSSVPGVTGYEAPSSRGNLGVALRGIGSGNASNLSIDPANGMYIDGVYLGKASGLGLDSMDLERIEVLRGPQGTLYGRNSTGGAINFITRKPGDEFGLRLSASAGSEGMQEFKGRIDVPFSETFLTSFSAQTRERDHLYDNTSGGEGFENIDRQGFRIAARWQPNDNFTADYSYESNEMDEEIQALDMVSFNPAGAGVLVADGFPTSTTINSRDRYNTVAAIAGGFSASLQFGLIPTGNSSSKGHIGSADSGHTSINENDGHSLTLAWAFDDMGALGDVEFKSITGWREMYNVNQGDLDGQDNTVDTGVMFHGLLQTIGGAYFGQFPGIPAATQFALANSIVDQVNARGRAEVFNSFQINDYEQFSQELQMVGSTDTVDYAVGLFYFDDEGERRANSLATYPLSATFANNYDNSGTAWSIYSQVTWLPSIESAWEITGGIRYTEEEKKVTQLHRSNDVIPGGFVGAFFAGIPFDDLYTETPEEALATMPEVAGVYGRSYKNDFDNVSGKFTVAYNFSDTVNGYATYSTGYRSGGFNGEAFDAPNDRAVQFNEETIESAEVGVKADLWDGRMRLNTAYFAYTYDDQQVSTLSEENGVVTSRTSNAGKTEANGLEIELTLLPTENLLLNLNYSYLNKDTKEFPPLIAAQSAGGATLATAEHVSSGLTPENQIMFNADWTIAEGEYGLLMLNVNGAWQDETFGIGLEGFVYNAIPDAASTPDTPAIHVQQSIDERTLLNARLALNEIPVGDGTLSVGVWGRNLLDEDYRAFSFNFGAGLGLNLAQYGEPSTYGIDFIYRY
jgi:iron complex outermembrane receptor protein